MASDCLTGSKSPDAPSLSDENCLTAKFDHAQAKITSRVTVDAGTGCWVWTGCVLCPERPYGRMSIGSRKDGTARVVRAHRFAFEAFRGPIPTGMLVCHHCDNPRCCNPQHLFLGTDRDNVHDMMAKGRKAPPSPPNGQDHPHAKLTNADVVAIRASHVGSRRLARQYGVDDSYIRAVRRGVGRVKA